MQNKEEGSVQAVQRTVQAVLFAVTALVQDDLTVAIITLVEIEATMVANAVRLAALRAVGVLLGTREGEVHLVSSIIPDRFMVKLVEIIGAPISTVPPV